MPVPRYTGGTSEFSEWNSTTSTGCAEPLSCLPSLSGGLRVVSDSRSVGSMMKTAVGVTSWSLRVSIAALSRVASAS